ncbi:MAG TPA: DUF3500 domain-containing protein, partial [Gammaproteobacteria bacterium]|nr:DUF3500 domain-containing protein [Gammaproteobacteria bacterium]
MHLVMFDIDGTLVDSTGFDSELYATAVDAELGRAVDRDWGSYEHVSDSGILEQLLRDTRSGKERAAIAARVQRRFVELVRDYLARQPGFVREIAGAKRLVERLAALPNVRVAVATGGWEPTARRALRARDLFRRWAVGSTCERRARLRLHRRRRRRPPRRRVRRPARHGGRSGESRARYFLRRARLTRSSSSAKLRLMKTHSRSAFAAVLLAGLLAGTATAQAPAAPTAQIADAAKALLATLSDAQRDDLTFAFDDEAQRKRWSNLPTGPFTRAGLRMGDLTETQRGAVRALLMAALSSEGYAKVMAIVEADEQLKNSTGRAMFGRDEYYVSFVGEPSATEPWLIQFGGHHLALNITLVGAQGTLVPSHTAAQPAVYELEGKTVRPLGREAEKAFALLQSLDDKQREKAVLGFEIRDLVLGPGRDGQTIQPEGIKGSDLSAAQREQLLGLAQEWTGIVHD